MQTLLSNLADILTVDRNAAGGDIDAIFGVAFNENLNNTIIVTVIATGFEEGMMEEQKVVSSTPRVETAQPKPFTVEAPKQATQTVETPAPSGLDTDFFSRRH